MCMALETLIVFLNLIGPAQVSSQPGIFTVHAEQGDIQWVETEALWCTDATAPERVFHPDLSQAS